MRRYLIAAGILGLGFFVWKMSTGGGTSAGPTQPVNAVESTSGEEARVEPTFELETPAASKAPSQVEPEVAVNLEAAEATAAQLTPSSGSFTADTRPTEALMIEKYGTWDQSQLQQAGLRLLQQEQADTGYLLDQLYAQRKVDVHPMRLDDSGNAQNRHKLVLEYADSIHKIYENPVTQEFHVAVLSRDEHPELYDLFFERTWLMRRSREIDPDPDDD